MSRVSKYDKSKIETNEVIWKAGLYLRLSKEDDVSKDESDSISSQRELLLSFIKKDPKIDIYNIYVDDGYSGTTFDRPNFQRMWEDIKNGRINCVVVKDLSRLICDLNQAVGVIMDIQRCSIMEMARLVVYGIVRTYL